MNVKHILGLSFCTLLLIILFQQAGVWFAYHTQMQKTEAVLASSFKETFILVTDAQVNRLPYAEGTLTHMVYAPDSLRLNDEDRQFYYAEQTSVVLQDGYGLPETSLDLRCLAERCCCRGCCSGRSCLPQLGAGQGPACQMQPVNPYALEESMLFANIPFLILQALLFQLT